MFFIDVRQNDVKRKLRTSTEQTKIEFTFSGVCSEAPFKCSSDCRYCWNGKISKWIRFECSTRENNFAVVVTALIAAFQQKVSFLNGFLIKCDFSLAIYF